VASADCLCGFPSVRYPDGHSLGCPRYYQDRDPLGWLAAPAVPAAPPAPAVDRLERQVAHLKRQRAEWLQERDRARRALARSRQEVAQLTAEVEAGRRLVSLIERLAACRYGSGSGA